MQNVKEQALGRKRFGTSWCKALLGVHGNGMEWFMGRPVNTVYAAYGIDLVTRFRA